MTVSSYALCVCIAGALCCLPNLADGALQVFLEEQHEAPSAEVSQYIFDQRSVVMDSLFKAIEDEVFRKGVTANMFPDSKNNSQRWLKNYCELSIIKCTGHKVTQIVLSSITNGRLHLAHLPGTLESLKVVESALDQVLNVDELPSELNSIEFHNVLFASNEAVISSTSPVLKSFVCRACNLSKVSFVNENHLEEVDLGSNPLSTVPANLPRSVRSLCMSNTLLAMPLKQFLSFLPRSLHSFDVGYSGITNLLEGFKAMSLHIRRVVVNGNAVNADLPSVGRVLNGIKDTLQDISMADCNLTGVIHGLRHLDSLLSLNVSHNRLSAVVWEEVPQNLVSFDASFNKLRGAMAAKGLLPALHVLNVSSNIMRGNVNPGDLPQKLHTLDLSNNQFYGNIDLTQLPESSRYVYIQCNHFQGTPNLVNIPVDIRHILIYNNNWDSLLPDL